MERTLILVKPDAFARGLTGEIIARFERKGLKIVAARHMTVTEELANQHYAEHEGKPFFGELVEFITSGPLVALVFEGESAIKAARQVIGATNPLEAAPGSIRGDFAIEVGQNMVHGSDSPESGVRRVARLAQHLAVEADVGVGAQHELAGHRQCLAARVLERELARVALRELLHIGGRHLEGHAQLLQDRPPLGRRAG